MHRIASLVTILVGFGLAGAQAQTPPPMGAAVRAEAIAAAGDLLRRNYVYPEIGAAAAERITKAQAAGDYDGLSDPAAFARRVTADLAAATHDKHVALISRVDAPDRPPPRTNGGFSRVERLKGNVGYARLDLFPPLGVFTPFSDMAMAALADTDALILDLRGNGGGAASSVVYFAGAFFDPKAPIHVGDLVNRTPGTTDYTTTALWTRPTPAPYLGKPLYILIGPDTFSGAEEFADAMRAQKRATLVGEVTGGGANPGSSWNLVGGRLRLFVPSSRAVNPVTGGNWESVGVTPDIVVPVDQALAVAQARLASELKAARPERPVGDLLPLRTKAQPEGGKRLRGLIADLAAGRPDFARMDADIAAAVRRMEPRMQTDLTKLGAVKSVTFRGVGMVGGDEYDVFFEHGWAVWMTYWLPDGRLSAFGFSSSL